MLLLQCEMAISVCNVAKPVDVKAVTKASVG